ncbi:MAG: alpha/beta hydrolase-fold protein [Acutalibacteraceae bacterium]|jgi:predicted peptidase
MKSIIVERKSENEFGYYLYAPNKEPDCKLPLIVFLHGSGERGNGTTDLPLVNKNALPRYICEGSEYPAFVLCPQCPTGFVWNNLVIPLKQLIDKIAEEYPVDSERISITGISMGGYGTWEMGITYPNFFSCISPVCGGGFSWRTGLLKNEKIWAFHGDADNVVPLRNSLEMVDGVNKNGGNAKLTIFHGVEHNSWDSAYLETKIIDWLLGNKRES